MKTHLIQTLILLMAFGTGTLYGQKKEKKDEQYKETLQIVESGHFEFEVQDIQASGGKNIRPTSTYKMQVKGSHFDAQLPYFGRAYQATLGGDLGVIFSNEAENMEVQKNEKKRTITLKFDIDGESDRYSILFTVFSGGNASLNVNSMKRQAISYTGRIKATEE